MEPLTPESAIDLLAQAGVMKGGRAAILAELMAHLCAECFKQQLHPQVIVAGGFELFAKMCRNTYNSERFTPFELQCMFECVKHYADNPQDMRAPREFWQELVGKARVQH